MNTKQFVLWLSGYLDACGDNLNEFQTEKVKEKLNNLFHHEAKTLNKIEESITLTKEKFKEKKEIVYRC